jgi:hypothetical protein
MEKGGGQLLVGDTSDINSLPNFLRESAQGLTLNNADEIEAFIRGVVGQDKNQELLEIRKMLARRKKVMPGASAANEALGSVVPGLALAVGTRGASLGPATARLLPNLAKISGLGAAEGAVQGYGASAGATFAEKIKDPAAIARSTAVGAVASPAAGAGLMGAAKVLGGASNLVGRLTGSTARSEVNDEVKRLVSSMNMPEEDIIQKIADGELLAEMPSIRGTVRSMRGQGGSPAEIITKIISERPDKTRLDAASKIAEGLGAGLNSNAVMYAKQSKEAMDKLDNIAYGDLWKRPVVLNSDSLKSMTDAIVKMPDQAKNLRDTVRAIDGRDPFFSVFQEIKKDANGKAIKTGKLKVKYTRSPTLQDAEILRRAIDESAHEFLEKGGKTASMGGYLKKAADKLREDIDILSPKLKEVRAESAQRKQIAEAFKAGQNVNFERGSESAEMLIAATKAKGESVFDAFKWGYRNAIKNQTEGHNKAGWAGRLADENTKEGRIFREIYPEELQPQALKKLGVAAQATAAKNKILGGSDTFESLALSQQIGRGISPSELVGVTRLDPSSMLNVATKVVERLKPQMTADQKKRVVEVLLSSNPQAVKKALTDNSYSVKFKGLLDDLSLTPYVVGGSVASTAVNNKLNRK